MMSLRARSVGKSSSSVALRLQHWTRPAAATRVVANAAARCFSTPARPSDTTEFPQVFARPQQAKDKFVVDVKGFLDMHLPALAYEGDASFLAGPTP
eukprot:2190749-Rhodomonas_salina.1